MCNCVIWSSKYVLQIRRSMDLGGLKSEIPQMAETKIIANSHQTLKEVQYYSASVPLGLLVLVSLTMKGTTGTP